MSKFSKDNNVLFEFHPNTCFVKDLATWATLLQGHLKDGLYVFTKSHINLHKSKPYHANYSLHKSCNLVSSPLIVLSSTLQSSNKFLSCNVSSTSATFHVWHNRLGHPNEQIVKCILSYCHIKGINKAPNSICSACYLGKLHKLPFHHSTTVYNEPLQLIHSDI